MKMRNQKFFESLSLAEAGKNHYSESMRSSLDLCMCERCQRRVSKLSNRLYHKSQQLFESASVPLGQSAPKFGQAWLFETWLSSEADQMAWDLKPIKYAAGQIHGADRYRAGQVILTAEIELASGAKIKVAVPNTGAGWRSGQKNVAIRLGFKPLNPLVPGSDIHAEENLAAFLQQTPGSKVLRWAISRGRGGTSNRCVKCQNLSKNWSGREW
jgi:hypothetical protein